MKFRADMARALEMFKVLPSLFNEVAEKHQCYYLNAGDYIVSSSADGYHLDAAAHHKLAEVIADLVKTIKL